MAQYEDMADLMAALALWPDTGDQSLASLRAAGLTSVPPRPLTNVTETALTTAPIAQPVEHFAGYTWGAVASNGTLYRSADNGATWPTTFTTPANDIVRVILAADGELIVFASTRCYKSIGWDGATQPPAWSATKITTTAGAVMLPWGVDGNGTKLIATEYSADRPTSRKAWVSTDAGETFTEAWDSVTRFGATDADASHLHAACYDPWSDRFYLAEGHNAIGGIYCSTDDGATWSRAAGMAQDPSPVVIVATDDGLCCASDNTDNGMFGVARMDDPADEAITKTWSWRTPQSGLIGFGQRGFRHPDTGHVYVGFLSNFANVKPIITAGTASAAGLVYTWIAPTVAGSKVQNLVITDDRTLVAAATQAGTGQVRLAATVPPPAAAHPVIADTGNALGGISADASTVAVGPGSSVTNLRGTAIGAGAVASGTDNTTALGNTATASGNGSTAVGRSAIASGINSLALGQASTASAVVGGNAIGQGATSSHNYSTALGAGVATTADNQVRLASRHLELNEMGASPAAPAANAVRIFAKDDGAGKTRLVARFATGAEVVIATEP